MSFYSELEETLLEDQRESDYLFFGKINVFGLSLYTQNLSSKFFLNSRCQLDHSKYR